MMVVEHEAFTFLYLVFSNPNGFLYRENHRKDNCKASLNLKIIAFISILIRFLALGFAAGPPGKLAVNFTIGLLLHERRPLVMRLLTFRKG